MKLFTGKLDVYEPDDQETWDWCYGWSAVVCNVHVMG
jgi:hypothetical protein